MGDITVIGLGLMGAALARTIQRAGHDLVVWNRSPAKMQPFIEDGVAAAPDLVSAITASPVILICIDNYAATKAMLEPGQVASHLAGRTVVQLSTGTGLGHIGPCSEPSWFQTYSWKPGSGTETNVQVTISIPLVGSTSTSTIMGIRT